MQNYDNYKLDNNETDLEYECDCCDFIGDEHCFTEVNDDGRTMWICETCLENKVYI